MRKKSRTLFKSRNLLWLFKKRFFFETRKYTAGIILTAGVLALFISMLILGSSFISAYYRANGEKGPNIFQVEYDHASIIIDGNMPERVNITCGISDYYPIDAVELHYSLNFWQVPKDGEVEKVIINGIHFQTTLAGNYYLFQINLSQIMIQNNNTPTTIMFFIWANNTAGFFNYDDNKGNYFTVRAHYEDEEVPFNPANLFQEIKFGRDNRTVTRNPRPYIFLEVNQSSNAWIELNNNASNITYSQALFYFDLPKDLEVGDNNLTIFMEQGSKITQKNFTITHITTPLNVTNGHRWDNTTIYNEIQNFSLVTDENVTALVELWSQENNTCVGNWSFPVYLNNFSLDFFFSKNFGNYTLNGTFSSYYGVIWTFNYSFEFMQSPNPHIKVLSPDNWQELVNDTLVFNVNFSDEVDVTFKSLNTSTSNTSTYNVFNDTSYGNYTLSNISLVPGINTINITAIKSGGASNSTIISVVKSTYLIHDFDYDTVVLPGGNLNITLNVSTNESVSGKAWYAFNYNGIYNEINFSLYQGNYLENDTFLLEGIVQALIPVPDNVSHADFNLTLSFGPQNVTMNNNLSNYHVAVEYFYDDIYGPEFENLMYNGILASIEKSNILPSNKFSNISIELFDVTGVKNATLVYSKSATFETNTTVNMTYNGTDFLTFKGRWYVSIPPFSNNTVVYFKIIAHDMLNNSAVHPDRVYKIFDYIGQQNYEFIPGVLYSDYENAISGAITTLLTIMILIIIVFITIFIMLNDQNVKREIYREENRIFILQNICKLSRPSIKKYYYIEQLVQDSIGYVLGVLIGYLFLAPVFVQIVKVTIVSWTFDFQELFYLSYMTLESWVSLLLLIFVISSLLLKLIQVDKYIGQMADKT
ncbi:MAG: hypothetical protein ACFFCS_06470 [Candidatus Hodarchaeota archaeon]